MISVTYWEDGEAVTRTARADDLPRELVLWVDLPHHRLQGMDNYWLTDTAYGMFNDARNYHRYEGKQAVAWSIDGTEDLGVMFPPPGAVVFHGVEIPDADAEKLGLI